MGKWIEVNIPFGPIEDDGIEIPEFDSTEVNKRYDGVIVDLVDSLPEKKWAYYNKMLYKTEDEILKEHPKYDIKRLRELTNKRMRELNSPTINTVIKHIDADNRYSVWLEKQPEWIEYCAQQDAAYEQRKQDSMRKRGLVRPGMLLELADGKQLLIGHINSLGGVCDDCLGIDVDDVVKRYRVVWTEEK